MHPQPTPSQVTDLEAALKRSRLVVRTIAKVTQAFPPMPADRMKRPPKAREGARVSMDGAHDWVFSAGFWRCGTCLKLSTRPEITQAMACEPCDGPKASLAVDAITGRGHVLAATSPPAQVLFCIRCGAFSARRAYGLGARCAGAPKPSGKQALARIRRGLQPWETRTAGGRQRGTLGQALAWDADRRTFVATGPARVAHRRGNAAASAPGRAQARARPRSASGDRDDAGSSPRLHESPVLEPPAKMVRTECHDSLSSMIVEPRAAADPSMEIDHVGGGGGGLEGRAPPSRALPRPDQRPELLRPPRPDGARGEGGPTGARRRQLLAPDPSPHGQESDVAPRRLCGPPESGSAVGSTGGDPEGDPGCPSGCAKGSASGSNGFSEVRPDLSGVHRDACSFAPPPSSRLPRPRPPPPERPRDRGREQGASAGCQPGDDRGEPAPVRPRGGDDVRDDDTWHLPWGGQPAWLYLPHLGAGGGADGVLAVRRAKRRREEGPPSPGAARPTGVARLALDGTVPTTARLGGVGRQPIRGQPQLLGPSSTAEEAARARLSARLAARNSSIQRSLDLHAERVAKRRWSDGPTAGADAAGRMAALRARVAARAAAACVDHNVCDAAARVADHARPGEPGADEGRQLMG